MSKLTFDKKDKSNVTHDGYPEQNPLGLKLPEDLKKQLAKSASFSKRRIENDILAHLRVHFVVFGANLPKTLKIMLANSVISPDVGREIIGILRAAPFLKEISGSGQ